VESGEWPSGDFKQGHPPEAEKFLLAESEKHKALSSDSGEISMFLWAMRAERRAERLYLELKELVSSKEGKDFFDFLAMFERGHYNFLDEMVENLTESEYLEN
jgi:rubrerythrin